ncbi:MAG: hypothetical protein LH679_19805 [Cyanobacteria bacterium CAN_BIN43]|nr:hypothetical protein [Cyanobacteria bacterium CAN_BIN43]
MPCFHPDAHPMRIERGASHESANLSEEEKEQIAQADRRFIQHAPQVLRELSQCVDLAGLGRDRSLTAILIDTPIFSPSDHASKVANQI